jgi:hypothetical protein
MNSLCRCTKHIHIDYDLRVIAIPFVPFFLLNPNFYIIEEKNNKNKCEHF